jgi:hypothetical protein
MVDLRGAAMPFHKRHGALVTEVADYYVGHFIFLLNVIRTSMPLNYTVCLVLYPIFEQCI